MSIKLDMDTLNNIAALEKVANVNVKDCIATEDTIYFVVEKGELGKAIGKKGINVNKLGEVFNKQIRIVEYSSEAVGFAKNFLQGKNYQTVSLGASGEQKSIIITADYKSRGAILGKKGRKVQILKDLLKRHHNVDSVKVQ